MPRPYSALLQRLETSWTLTTALLCGLLLPLMSSSVQAQTGTFLDSCDSSSPYTCFGYDTDAIINSTSVVTIANCEFIGCPEVYALSPMNFINVTFTSSTYQYSDAVPGGGAIRIMADVSISNSTFHSCQAASSSHA